VNDAEGQEARARRAGRPGPEVRLSTGGGRAVATAARSSSPPVRVRLKRSLELFESPEGPVYLLRSGAKADFWIEEPTSSDRLILRRLARGYVTEQELSALLQEEDVHPTGDLACALAELENGGLLERELPEPLLSPRELQRYDRQLIYFADIAPAGTSDQTLQRRLRDARVALIGCGGLGSWTACGLASAGVGSLVLVDDDRVELSNLNRQLLFREADIGHLKVEAAAAALRAYDSDLVVEPVVQRVSSPQEIAAIAAGSDLLVVTADWPPFELPRWVNRACQRTATPYITAGQFLPVVRVGPMVIPGHSACVECVERFARRAHPSYEFLSGRDSTGAPPAANLGAPAGIVGSMLATEAVHLLIGAGEPASVGRALVLDLREMRLEVESVERDLACPECGAHTERAGGKARTRKAPGVDDTK
jgi:bacteriocin biosynthesis cyclodehydratase domain-containing protein